MISVSVALSASRKLSQGIGRWSHAALGSGVRWSHVRTRACDVSLPGRQSRASSGRRRRSGILRSRGALPPGSWSRAFSERAVARASGAGRRRPAAHDRGPFLRNQRLPYARSGGGRRVEASRPSVGRIGPPAAVAVEPFGGGGVSATHNGSGVWKPILARGAGNGPAVARTVDAWGTRARRLLGARVGRRPPRPTLGAAGGTLSTTSAPRRTCGETPWPAPSSGTSVVRAANRRTDQLIRVAT